MLVIYIKIKMFIILVQKFSGKTHLSDSFSMNPKYLELIYMLEKEQ